MTGEERTVQRVREAVKDITIKDIEAKLTGLLEDNDINCVAFVTHHAIEISILKESV